MQRDTELKAKLARLFWNLGYMPHFEVLLGHPTASQTHRRVITDIDVLGVKVTEELAFSRLAGDCKTLAGVSPVNRSLWLKGVLGYTGSHHGYLVVSKYVEEDHKLLAYANDITLVSEAELDVLSAKLSGGTAATGLALLDPVTVRQLEADFEKHKEFANAREYARGRFWSDPPTTALRKTMAGIRGASANLDVSRPLHLAFALSESALFATALLHVVLQVFHVYLVVNSKDELSAYLKAFLWGGRDAYNFYNRLILATRNPQPGLSAQVSQQVEELSLPEWDRFLQLVRSCLEWPLDIRECGRLLHVLATEPNVSASTVTRVLPNLKPRAVQAATEVLLYVEKAAGLRSSLCRAVEKVTDALLVSSD